MDCVWACTKMMDRPRKRIRGRSAAARLRRVIPATRKHVSRASLPISNEPASPGHSDIKTQESSRKDRDSNGTTHIEVVLSCAEDQRGITSPLEAEETSSTAGCISGPSMDCRDLESNIPTCKSEPWKVKASSKEEYEDPVKKLRASDTEYKQELSVGGNIVGKSGLQNENTLSPENQGIHLKSVFDQHSGSDNVTSAIKLGEEIASNTYGQHHENNQSVSLEGVHYDDNNGISFVKLGEKNAECTDVQHSEKDNGISSLMLVANDTWDKHQENNTLSINLDGGIADSTIKQHGEKNGKISSIMLDGQNADYSDRLHNVDNGMSSAEFGRETAGIGSCTLTSEIGHVSKEAEILNKSQMLIKKKMKREGNICNSDNVKEGVIRKQEVINTPSGKYIEDSVVTEEKKTEEKIENKSKEGSALALQMRGLVRISDKETSSRNIEDRGGASPNNDVNLKENDSPAQKKPVMKKYPNIRLESKVVSVPCNDAESTLKEKGTEDSEKHLHLQKLTSVTYPLSNFMEAKVLDFQPSSCTVTKAKKSLTKTTILGLSSSLCKISEEQGHAAIDTIGSRSEELNNSERDNTSIETPGIACVNTSDAILQNQNTAVYCKPEEMQDKSTWFTNDQRTVQTLLEQEREKNVEIGKQTGMLISECSGLGTLIIDEENSHRIVADGNLSLHDQDSDSKEVSRDGHNLLNLIAQNSLPVVEGFSCSENMGSTVFEDEFSQPIEGTKSVMREEIYNNEKNTESKESLLDVQETNDNEKDDLDMENFTARINVDCQWQDLNSVDEKRAESNEERHAQKFEKHHQRGLDVNEGGTSMKGFEFEGFVKVRKIEREITKAVKDDICSESVDCLVQKQACKGVPQSSGVEENTSDSLLQSNVTNISHSQVKMTSLLTISGALGCKKQLLIVPRSYLTVELVMAAISLGKFSYKDIHSWVCKICRPVNRNFTEVNRKQFMQYELLHRIILKSCDAKRRSHWEEILRKTLYVLPRGEGWSLIFEKIPDICQDLVTCDSGFSNITKKKPVAFFKKYRSNTPEEKLELVVKKLQQKSTQVKVLKGKQMSASRELKNMKEKLQEKINGLRTFIKVHGGRNPDSYLKPSSSKNQKAEKNFITETEEVLANLYELVGKKEMKNGELQQEVADLKVVIDEKDKVIQQKNKLGCRTEAKVVIPIESRSEKKQKDHVLQIKHLQEKLRKTKELVSYEELCSSQLREELRTQRQLLGERDRMIAHNEKKIADLKSDAISCRSFHGQLEHKLHIAHCSLQERDVYIRSLEDQYYGVSQDLKMANFNLQEKISVIQQQQNLLDQQKEKYHWSSIDNQKNQSKQNGNELVNHYMEEYNKHLADLENRLIQCNNILSEKENFIKQLQKNFSDYQAFVKERESQLAVSRICRKCSEPASKFDCELPNSSWVQSSDEKNPTKGELLARKDEKLRSAYKRVQELHGEVEYLVERTKAGSSTSDLKETLEMKRKNAALQQCIITREEMNAQLEEKLSVQNKELAHFKEQLQTKSTIIEYLQNFIIDKEPITVNTDIENVGIAGNTQAENKASGNCERDRNRDFLGSDPVHSPLMKSSVGQVESQGCCSNHEHAMNSPHVGEYSKVQQGVLTTQKEISAPDKNDIGIYQNKTDTETGSYCSYKNRESTGIASLFEEVPQAETRKTFKENVGSYSNKNVGSQKTTNLHGESQSYSGVVTYEKHCNTISESSKLMQGQKTSDINLEHRRMNLEINMPENSEKQFVNCDSKKGICDQLPKCEQGRNIEAADGERKTFEEKESKETEKPSPVKITYSEYCMRNKNKIFPLSTSNNHNETGVGRERLYSSENISQESGWHGDNYSNITRERKHQNLEAGYGEMGRKRNLSKEMTLEIEQTNSKESKRSKFDVDKKGKVLLVKENTAKISPRIPEESKTKKIINSGNRQVKSKDPLEEIRKLKKFIEDLKYRNEKALTKEIARRVKVETVSRKREIVLAQILEQNQKMKRQVKESDVALTLIERERERVNQLLLENERALVEAARTKEKFSRSLEEKDKALENNQKELEDFKVDLKRKEKTHEKEIEKYKTDVSSIEKEVGTLKLCLAKREELYEKEFAATNEIIKEKKKALENLLSEKSCLCGDIRNKGEELLSVKEEVMKLRNSLIEQREEISVYQVGKSQENEERTNSLIEAIITDERKSLGEEKHSAQALSLEEAIGNLDCIIQDIKGHLASLKEELSKIDAYKFNLIQDMMGEKESLQNASKLQQERLNETVAEHENCRTKIEALSESLASEAEKSKEMLEEAQNKMEQKEQEAERLTTLKKHLEAELETNKKHYTLLIEKESYWKQQLSNAQNCIEELTAAKSFLAQQLQAIDISKEQLRKELKLGIPKQKVWNLDQELTKVCDLKRQLDEEKKKSLGVSRHLLEEKNRNKNLLRKLERKENLKNTGDPDQPTLCTSESQTTSSLEEEMHTILENNRKVQLTLEAERQVSEDFYKELVLEKRKNAFLNDCFKHECTESSKDMEHQLSFFTWMADKYRARMRRMDELSSTMQEFTENLEDQ